MPQAACASAFPAASLGQLFLWLHDTALIGIEAGQALASYGVHLADRLRAASAARGKVGPAAHLILTHPVYRGPWLAFGSGMVGLKTLSHFRCAAELLHG